MNKLFCYFVCSLLVLNRLHMKLLPSIQVLILSVFFALMQAWAALVRDGIAQSGTIQLSQVQPSLVKNKIAQSGTVGKQVQLSVSRAGTTRPCVCYNWSVKQAVKSSTVHDVARDKLNAPSNKKMKYSEYQITGHVRFFHKLNVMVFRSWPKIVL